jgi:hypothetical protein
MSGRFRAGAGVRRQTVREFRVYLPVEVCGKSYQYRAGVKRKASTFKKGLDLFSFLAKPFQFIHVRTST